MRSPIWLQLRNISKSALTAHMAWQYIEDYAAMASVQLGRIHENNAVEGLASQLEHLGLGVIGLSPEEFQGVRDLQSAQLTADAHFYLNCWRLVGLNAFRIAKSVGHEKLEQFLVDQQCPTNRRGDSLYFGEATPSYTLGWYAQGRDHFEHIDERIFGERNWDKLRVDSSRIAPVEGFEHLWRADAEYFPSPHFNGTHMVVGESTWEITPSAHRKLLNAVSQLHQIGQDLLSEQDPE